MQVFLETGRLILRRFTAADADNLADLDADPDVMRYVNGGVPTSRAEIENEYLPAFLAYYEWYEAFGFWAAVEKTTGDFLGWFHFRPRPGAAPGEVELGYRLRTSAWGKGYATEGSRALIRTGFSDSGVQRVTAEAAAANLASRHVLEKAGLSLVRTFRQPWPGAPGIAAGGPEIEAVEYALTRSDWERQVFPVIRQTVLDTTDPRGLAEFYRQLFGLRYHPGDEPPGPGEPDPNGQDWLILTSPAGGATLAFQKVGELHAATWPDGPIPQQLHLDSTVPTMAELDVAHARALALGAQLIEDRSDDPEEPLRVYADPAGHPFCIIAAI